MRKSTSGFTVVEILVVVVIIGILAVITLATYNGSQQRARSAQTTSAATQWIKALMMYKARTGGLPTMNSCLGADDYKYGSTGTATTGTAQCYQNGGVNIVINSSFMTLLAKYMSGYPSPAMVSAVNSGTSWYRGLSYVVNSTANTAQLVLTLDAGQACPAKIGDSSLTSSAAASSSGKNMICMYGLGSTVSY